MLISPLCRCRSSSLCSLTTCLRTVINVLCALLEHLCILGHPGWEKSESSAMTFSPGARYTRAHSFGHFVLDMTNELFNYVWQNNSYCLIDFIFNFFIQIFKFLRLVNLVVISFPCWLPSQQPLLPLGMWGKPRTRHLFQGRHCYPQYRPY